MGSSERIRVVQYGLDPIGLMAVRQMLARRDLELVGAIDMDPEKHQRDVADLSGLKLPSGIRVSNRPREVLGVTRPRVVLHTGGSRLKDVFSQIGQCLEVGARVVSTCDELVAPAVDQPVLAGELDRMARARDSIVVGTGTHPGLVMNTMALVASAPCLTLGSVRVERVVDVSSRRESVQRQVGAGLTPAEFRRGLRRGELGYKGLRESLLLLAQGMSWDLDKVTERLKPVLASRPMKTKHLTIKKGQVAGIHHTCRGLRDRKEVLHLELQMIAGAKRPMDRISVQGKPPVAWVLEGGLAGDDATVGLLLNMVRHVIDAPPGLRAMIDLPVPRFRAWK